MRRFNKPAIFGSGGIAKRDQSDKAAGEHVENGKGGGVGGTSKGRKEQRIWNRQQLSICLDLRRMMCTSLEEIRVVTPAG